MFHLSGESVAYENNIALKNITLDIGRGEKVALIGPSGAGKTTLLRTLYERAANQSAFVHQHYALVPQLSVFHNTYIGRLDRHSTWYNILNLLKPRKQILKDVVPVLQALGLEDKTFEKVGALSGGQQQRVAVGRALYRGESILLADEPVSSVDPHQADAVMELIMQTETVIMSLHAVDVALKFAERIIGLREGQLHFDLSADHVTPTMLW
ncbi:MAG: ATP-binding cassette domain-containing protein, partial [Candidatus Tectomicrobia bacterium]|nr:ATP-binding cassette domain-containing protein [Candidatus Tectomicrobia bacterium]